MKDLRKRIEELQTLLKKHRRAGLKELPTRTIFIDPLLDTLGWDVRDTDEVELEYSTIDSKAVDYALKINRKPVIFLEAKALDDPLDDVKAITQVVGYAANEGVNWCVLTNGVRYKVYSSEERTTAPNKLLFEVSIDLDNTSDDSVEQMVSRLSRLSRDAVAEGILDKLGEETFTTAKVRKALDKLFAEKDNSFVRLIRKTLGDEGISPSQIRAALSRIWQTESISPTKTADTLVKAKHKRRPSTPRDRIDYGEALHTNSKPAEVVELYRTLDRFCQNLAPGKISRRYLAKCISWTIGKTTFCEVHLMRSGLKVWLSISFNNIPASVTYARDVSNVGHWGSGNVEMRLDSTELLQDAEQYIRMAYESAARSNV